MASSTAKKVIVETPLGKVMGCEYVSVVGDTLFIFQGIPYAKPPVKNLRFKSPEPVDKWDGVLQALAAGPIAPYYYPNDPLKLENMSEDCLYLNIYTPNTATPGLNLPVMVWFHHGSFNHADGSKESFGPDYLVPKGVILVSLNFRLGALGFLSFRNKECPGNFGLKDQTMALRWIKENISGFGGDPNNVTIFGGSAGGAAVQYHMLSPISRGLFHKAISQSGSIFHKWAYGWHPVECGLLLARRLGCKSDNVEDAFKTIQKAPVGEIIKHTVGIYKEVEGEWPAEHIFHCFLPTYEPEDVEDAFLTKHPYDAIEEGNFADVPYITGGTDFEGMLSLVAPNWKPPAFFSYYQTLLPKELKPVIGDENTIAAAKKVKEFFFPKGSTTIGFVEWFTIFHGHAAVAKFLNAVSKKNKSPAYLYLFTASRPDSAMKTMFKVSDMKGSMHGDEWGYMFLLGKPVKQKPIAKYSAEHKVSENLLTLWTDFAKNGKFSVNWPRVKGGITEMPYLQIDQRLEVKENFFSKGLALYEDVFNSLKKE